MIVIHPIAFFALRWGAVVLVVAAAVVGGRYALDRVDAAADRQVEAAEAVRLAVVSCNDAEADYRNSPPGLSGLYQHPPHPAAKVEPVERPADIGPAAPHDPATLTPKENNHDR